MQLAIAAVVVAPPRERRSPTSEARLLIDGTALSERSPFLFLAEDWFAPPAGFPTHPHRGMETVTFVLDGAMIHRDHTGAHGVLRKGDAQFMTAGSGILHSEMPGDDGVHSLQLWLNLPAALKRSPARYRDMPATRAAIVAGPGSRVRVYAGAFGDVIVPHGSTWPLTLMDVELDQDASLDLPVPAGHRAFALVLGGDVGMAREGTRVRADQIAWLAIGQGGDGSPDLLSVTAVEPSRLLMFASPVIDEPIAMRGPFVMTTEAEITEAFADYRAGRLTSRAPQPIHA